MSKGRKTRQEKIIADLRRKLGAAKRMEQEVGSVEIEIPKISHITPRAAGIASGDARQNQASITSFPTSYSYIKRDLTKTLVLAILAISLEVVLFFLLG